MYHCFVSKDGLVSMHNASQVEASYAEAPAAGDAAVGARGLQRRRLQQDTATRRCDKTCDMALRHGTATKPKKEGVGGAFTALCAFWSCICLC